jgi:putative flippase GtrA
VTSETATRFAEPVRFILVGVVNTVDYYALFLLLHTKLWYLVAHVIAFTLSMCGSFFLNCWFTYRVRPTLRKFLLFPVTNATNFVITTGGVAALVQAGHMEPRYAVIVAAVFAVPFTFVLSRRILKGSAGRAAEPHATSPA